jgi:hypothetical protein
MAIEIPQEVIDAFTGYSSGLPKHSTGKTTAEPIGNGLINHTYKINCGLQSNFLLQKINTHVFNKPEDVQANCNYLCQYAEFEFTGLRLPYIKYFGQAKSLYKDQNGNYWRAFEFIEDGTTFTIATKPAQAKATAKAFAKFTAAFDEMNVENLKETIPRFHDLSLRYSQFEEALKTELYERMPKALPLAEELKKREKYKFFYEEIVSSDAFPKRVVHHDAKISNVLFSKANGKVICPVDLDTTMPGYFFSDPGDMIRSMACSADENSKAFEKLSVRKSYYEAITEGYLSVMSKWFTNAEKKYFHYCGLLIVYMQALRFLTDYLNGDIYYRKDYPEQNFDRAFNQFTLLTKLEEFLRNNYNLKS